MSAELEQLRTFRAGDAAPDPAARAAARAALAARIEAAAANLAPSPAQTPEPGRALVRRRARRRGRAAAPPRRTPRAALFTALGALAATAAAAVVVALGVGAAPDDDAARPGTTPAGRDAAPPAAEPAVRPGQWWYQRVENFGDGGWRDRSVREDWHTVDGGWRMVQRGSRPMAQEKPPGRGRALYTFFPDVLTYAQASAMPTDVGALYARVERAAEHWAEQGDTAPMEHEMFTIVGDWLRASPPLPPELRRALFRVGERIPGVRRFGNVADRVGRPGRGIAEVERGGRRTLVFDPRDARLLEERTTRPGGRPVWHVNYFESGVVRSPRARP